MSYSFRAYRFILQCVTNRVKNYSTWNTMSVKEFVNGKIAGKKVVVFSKSSCPYCTKAKDVLRQYVGKEISEGDYEVIEIENDPRCQEIQDYLQQLTKARSVPRVFVKGKCIGGGDDTAAAHKNGKLKSLLA
ncbi:hypothetical protein CHS0354_004377 [Potamilus streckersoni]|uniref:Glutaredoxin domain-containing protein n=1 Tax=Potamilus streckersoni TaxID=2493646 RepID=A0AAE0T0W4_9BIVA|nr:hypothetical protein CHS0354_004377 [Potamilus streckersoni]